MRKFLRTERSRLIRLGPMRMLRPAFPAMDVDDPAVNGVPGTSPRGTWTKCALEGSIELPFASLYPVANFAVGAMLMQFGSATSATLLRGASGFPMLGRSLLRMPSPFASVQAPKLFRGL